MINDHEIDSKAGEFGINPSDVEKDYVHGWLLNGIYMRSPLGRSLILKGGSGLRKAYLPNTRFSKDLDFSVQQMMDQDVLENELKNICGFIEKQTQVHFSKDKTIVKNKDLQFGIDVLETRLYFKGFYGDESLTLKAQLDITQFDKIYLPIQERRLLHPYSDAEQCGGMIHCQKIEEILASKLTALLHRSKAIHLFDLLYSIMFTSEFPVNRWQVITTFLKKSIFEAHPALAKNQLLTLPLGDFRPLWSTIVTPAASFFNFDYVLSNFKLLIESLFELINVPISPVSRGGSPTPRTNGRFPTAYSQPSPFSSEVRNVIATALRTQTLVEFLYDKDVRPRLIEPYRIEYYVRKSDGVGSEYFLGYDRTGGKTGPGVKRFFCEKIRSARATLIPSAPPQVPLLASPLARNGPFVNRLERALTL
jgi:predicted nucleotidyltransferase component of viral defense system